MTVKKKRRLWTTLRVLTILALGATLALRMTAFGLSVTPADPERFAGTQAMAERLAEYARGFDGDRSYAQRIPIYALLARYFEEIKDPPDARSAILIDARTAELALQKGESQQAIDGFLRVRTAATAHPELFDADFRHALGRQIAIAWLRLGEQQNCAGRHNGESCLWPIAGGGVHTLKQGAHAAAAEYVTLLDEFPDDVSARWLLNVAAMLIGEHPAAVPAKWRLPAGALESEYPLPRFAQIAERAGLDLEGQAGGVVADDFDGDGYLDLMISRMTLGAAGQLRFFHNNADGSFTDRTAAAGLTGITGGLHITQTDYDNDGALDLLIPRGAWAGSDGNLPLSLLRNDGHGHFSDVTVQAGLLAFHPTQTAAWADFDNDGFLDLYVGYETFTLASFFNFVKHATDVRHDHPVGTPSFKRHPCALYHNNHDGTFTDVAARAGADVVGFVKGVVAGDFDNDGRIDLYLSRLIEGNLLLHNDGDLHFTDVTARAGVAEPMFSFPTWFFDYDNDGWLDIFVGDSPTHLGVHDGAGRVAASYFGLPPPVSKTTSRSMLYRNNHDGTFSDVTAQTGLAKIFLPMGSSFGDLDNDGWPDFYLGTGNASYEVLVPSRMLRNAEGRAFQDVTAAGGFGHLQKGHGLTFADLDEDGDQDIYAVMGGAFTGDVAHNALYENPGSGNHFLKLELVGTRSNRAAIGARIRVTVDTEAGPRTVFSSVTTGGSFGGAPLRRELGLGRARAITSIDITWPSGAGQRLENLALDRSYRVREGEPAPTAITRAAFKLGGAAQR